MKHERWAVNTGCEHGCHFRHPCYSREHGQRMQVVCMGLKCAYDCAQLQYTTQHRTVPIIFTRILLTIIIAHILSIGDEGQKHLSLSSRTNQAQRLQNKSNLCCKRCNFCFKCLLRILFLFDLFSQRRQLLVGLSNFPLCRQLLPSFFGQWLLHLSELALQRRHLLLKTWRSAVGLLKLRLNRF